MTSLLLVLPEVLDVAISHSTERAATFAREHNFSVKLTRFDSSELQQEISTHEFIIFMPRSSTLVKHSLVELVKALQEHPESSVAYSDDTNFELPDFSPQRFLCQNFLQGPVVVRSSPALNRIDVDQDLLPVVAVHKLLLELDRQGLKFAHLASALSEQKTSTPLELSTVEVTQSREVLISERSARGGGVIGEYLGQAVFESRGAITGNPLISIVVPTRATYADIDGTSQSLVINAVKSIVEKTTYPHYELVIVVDSGADENILSSLKEIAGERLRLVEWDKPFNFSQKMNFGVLHASAEFVLLLNDDVEVISPMWLSSMLSLAQLPNAGMVGAMLYYEDDTVQHAGHAYYQGSPTHIGLGLPRGSRGPLSGYLVQREAPGVTAACALMPIEVFKAVGGFTALLPGNFNDVDLCLKVGWKGYDIYWTPDAELYHFESKTRDAHVHYYELDVIEHRWGLRLSDSRYWRGHPWSAK